MAVTKSPLGMNARNFLYIRPYNKSKAKRLADDKLATKRVLSKNNLTVGKLYASFLNHTQVRGFDFSTLPKAFAIKPSHGYGGEGVVIIKDWNGFVGKDFQGDVYSSSDLRAHLFDILEGSYSLQHAPDSGFIEELLTAKHFLKNTPIFGLPDIRIVVFRGVPVMAMLRLPTKESSGKANIHQGAIGIGIDVATGVTTNALLHDKYISRFPETRNKLHGLRIPKWNSILELSVKTQQAVGLGFAGVDIVIDENHGPVVLEVNARPGLEIQNVNRDSLWTRLERIGDIKVPTAERGIDIAKSLFAGDFAHKVADQKDKAILGIIEDIIINVGLEKQTVEAKIDTGAYRTSIDGELVNRLGLKILKEKVQVYSASGYQTRSLTKFSYILGGKKINSIANITDRKKMKFPIIIGRLDLKDVLVDPNVRNQAASREEESERPMKDEENKETKRKAK